MSNWLESQPNIGDRLVYLPDPPPPASHLNSCGVAAASPAFAPRLRALCETMRATPAAAARLAPWGLQVGAVAGSLDSKV